MTPMIFCCLPSLVILAWPSVKARSRQLMVKPVDFGVHEATAKDSDCKEGDEALANRVEIGAWLPDNFDFPIRPSRLSRVQSLDFKYDAIARCACSRVRAFSV